MDKDNTTEKDAALQFLSERQHRVDAYANNTDLMDKAQQFSTSAIQNQYPYNFDWLGRPIIQFPQDIVAVQELIWRIRPDLIIETGIAHGGSLILSASMLALLDSCDAIAEGKTFDPAASKRKVLGIDIDIRDHNRVAIEQHPMSSLIEMIQGSSVDAETIGKVERIAEKYSTVLVMLDSNHTHDHVLRELELYAPLTSVGSYCVVFDSIVEDLPEDTYPDRPWGRGDNPKTAVHKYLTTNDSFVIDKSIQDKLLITVAPDGFLKKKK